MTAGGQGPSTAGRLKNKSHDALIAAFREGLGLVAIVLTRDGAAIRIVPDGAAPDEAGAGRWWCRRRADAERLVAAATERLRRASRHAMAASDRAAFAGEAIAAAAERLAIAIWSDADVAREATAIIARVEAEFARLQAAGDMKAINKSYREARLQAAAHGEKVPPYAQWINKYRQNLVRRLAAALRYS